jgi:hypothetical protein
MTLLYLYFIGAAPFFMMGAYLLWCGEEGMNENISFGLLWPAIACFAAVIVLFSIVIELIKALAETFKDLGRLLS